MNRIAIVGDSGSGKTWLGTQLAKHTGYAHIELDALYWQEDWTPLPQDRLEAKVATAIAADAWIIDGNYGSLVQPMVLEAADTVVWLDLPRWRIMMAITRRTFGRIFGRRELWNGNRERLHNLFNWEPEENIIRWAWVQHARHRSRYRAMMSDRSYTHLNWVRLETRREVNDWLATMATAPPNRAAGA